MPSTAFVPTARTRVKRLPARASYDRAVVHAILDEALVCHLGFTVDGRPCVIPTVHARLGERLVVHGSAASRALRALADGVDVCVTVTLVDGLVLARSAFHHSINYRSVVLFGTAVPMTDPEEKRRALEAIVEHVLPRRWADVRQPNATELKATAVLSLPIEEVSAKVRTGPPLDDPADMGLPCWAGELPLRMTPLAAVADPALSPGVPVPANVAAYRRPGAAPR